ncbi:GNAT family N-acetyltransferase [Micromonospora sp. DT53]|uniref:GNAT family N-acetyltransferase n=1 Tax=Micromonospora sp. DT53 TaxID=3393444 RepID=UPI003CEE960D
MVAAQLYSSYRDLPPAWDTLAGDDFYSTRSWLRHLAQLALAEERHLMSSDGRLGAAGYWLPAPTGETRFLRPDSLLPGHPTDDVMPVLLIGGWRVYGSQLVGDHAAVDDFLAGVTERGMDLGARSIFMPYVALDASFADSLSRQGWTAHPAEPTAVLDVDFADFAGYLAARSKKRRSQIRQELAAVEQARVVLEFAPLTHDRVRGLAEHDARAAQAHGMIKSIDLAERSLAGLANLDDGRSFIGTATADDRLVAFVVVVVHRNQVYVRQFVQVTELPGVPVYFSLTYYAVIELALRERATIIHFGLKAEEPKVLRGCRLVEQQSFIKLLGERRTE